MAAARGLGQQRDGQGEGAAGGDQELLQIGFAPRPLSVLRLHAERIASLLMHLGAGHGFATEGALEQAGSDAVGEQGGDADAGQLQGRLQAVAHAARRWRRTTCR